MRGLGAVPAVSITDGLQLLVQLMTAAMTTEPWASWYSWPQCRKGTRVFCFSLETWKPLKPTCRETEDTLGPGQTAAADADVKGRRGLLPSHRDSSGSLLSCCRRPRGPEASLVRSRRAPWSSG